MSTFDIGPGRNASAKGHIVTSVIAADEPQQHYQRAIADLSAALPSPQAFDARGSRLVHLVTTPDFHPGKPVPVGVTADIDNAVLPHLIGNDIGCGMRMIALDNVDENDLGQNLDRHLRHVFFQGGRDIALTGYDRNAILRDGLAGLMESLAARPRLGLLSRLDFSRAWADLDRTADAGGFAARGVDPDFEDYGRIDPDHRRDAILGTIGGGNHFVELGVVDRIEDREFANCAGLRKGTVTVIVHSGSLDFGQRIGAATRERLMKTGQNRHAPILSAERDRPDFERYMVGHDNAANIAFANRLLIGLAAIEALSRAIGREIGHRLVYDAPHNTVWAKDGRVQHRKGACPARGGDQMLGTPYAWQGEPVILPGSMGDGAWLLKGLGAEQTLQSSAHGAGRRLSRQEARATAALSDTLRVVGPVDLGDFHLRGRPDIMLEAKARLLEEAPSAYRPIESVVDPMVKAGMVGRVAKITPMITVKG